MKDTYEYTIKDEKEEQLIIKCKAEYNTDNAYDTTYYFYNGNRWLKDFIDLNKLSPDNEEQTKEFEEFITRVHDYMVHGNIWQEMKEMENNEEIIKEQYGLVIKSKKIEE